MDIKSIIVQKIDLPEFIKEYAGVELSRHGDSWRGKCPIHKGENPTSFSVTGSLYYCYACNSGGTVINFVSDYDHISYSSAIELLAKMLNINLKDDAEYKACKDVESGMEEWKNRSKKNVGLVSEYLIEKRGFTQDTISEFELGSYQGSLTIPLIDSNGRTVGMARRQFDKKPKYINTKNNILFDKSAFLFNMDKARRLIKSDLYVVEGYMDAISGHQMGIPTVAYCSNELHRDQIRTIANYCQKETSIVLFPDNDEEGQKRIPRVRDYFKEISPNRQVRVVIVPAGYKDMNDLLLAGINPTMLDTLHIDRYVMDLLLSLCHTEEEEYKTAEDYLPTVSSPMIKLDIIKELSQRWNKDEDILKRYFNTVMKDADDIIKEASGISDCIGDLREIYKTGGYQTYFSQIDACIRRVEKKQVIIVGAYPGVGKTDFAIEMALRAVIKSGLRIVFFSLEMPKGKLIERMIAKLVGCTLPEVEGYLASDDLIAQKVVSKLENRMIIFDGNHLSMDEIDNRIKLLNTKNVLGGPIDMVFVDYFGYLKGTSTFEDASTAAKKMKGIAKDNNIIFVMLSQLNRGGSSYSEPTMSLLKSTGDLEASADLVFLLWRPDKDPEISLEDADRLRYVTRLKIDKARDGMFAPNLAEFRYDPKTSRLKEDIE